MRILKWLINIFTNDWELLDFDVFEYVRYSFPKKYTTFRFEYSKSKNRFRITYDGDILSTSIKIEYLKHLVTINQLNQKLLTKEITDPYSIKIF